MADITIIGAGNMGSGIAARAVAAGRSLQILDRTAEKAAELVGRLGVDAEVGVVGDAPTGTIVVLAVPFDGAKDLATAYGSTLAGRTVIDICNPVDYTTFDSLVVAPGTSAAEAIADLADPGAHLVKAFNTTFASTLRTGEVDGQPLDVFIAGDSQEGKATVTAFVTDAGLRPIDAGPLRRARELEGFQFLVMTLQVNPGLADFNWNTALKLLTP